MARRPPCVRQPECHRCACEQETPPFALLVPLPVARTTTRRMAFTPEAMRRTPLDARAGRDETSRPSRAVRTGGHRTVVSFRLLRLTSSTPIFSWMSPRAADCPTAGYCSSVSGMEGDRVSRVTFVQSRWGLTASIRHRSLTKLRDRLSRIVARLVRHARYVTFPLAHLAVPRDTFAAIILCIQPLAGPPSS